MSQPVAYSWPESARAPSSRKKKLLIAGTPFLILGLVLVSIGLVAPPMLTAVSNEQQSIPPSPQAGYYYYVYWEVGLSASQRAEFQFSSNRPVDYVVMDKENFDRYLNNQTFVPSAYSSSEFENTHSFTPDRQGTYHFMLQNISGQEATVTVTIRRASTGLTYVGGAFLVLGGVLMTLGFVLKPKAVDMPAQVLGMVKMHGRIMISELASRFSTTQTDIELTLIRLRNMGEPISYVAATGEVSYGPQPRPPEAPAPPPSTAGAAPEQSAEPSSQPADTAGQ